MRKNFFSAMSTLCAALALVGLTSCDNKGNEPEPKVDPDKAVDLVLSTSNVTVGAGESVTVEITSGNGGYTTISADEAIAKASVSGTTITIEGVKGGSTTISVKDAAKKAKPISVKVSASGVNNIRTDIKYTITVFDNEEGYTNWWKPTLTKEAKGTYLCTKRDFVSGAPNAIVFDDSTLKEFFETQDDDNVFVCGGYLGEGTKPDYGYAALALLLTDQDDPAHPGCKVMTVITTNLAAYLSWSAYSSTPGTAYYDPADGSFTLVDCKGFLDWDGSDNEKWHFVLNRKYTPEN